MDKLVVHMRKSGIQVRAAERILAEVGVALETLYPLSPPVMKTKKRKKKKEKKKSKKRRKCESSSDSTSSTETSSSSSSSS